jgi:hypothetical protein
MTASWSAVAAAIGSRARGTFPAAAASLIAAAIVIACLDLAILPYVLREGATDWAAYEQAGKLMASHQNPYAWADAADIRALTPYPYLYPPPLAWLWGVGFTPGLWLALKIASLGGLAAFAWRYASTPGGRLAVAVSLFGIAVAFPPVVHDLILGNVMVLYLATIAVLSAWPDRRWAVVPLAVLMAIAFKPFVAPIVLWLLIRDPARFVDLVAVAVGLTLVFALMIGPTPYGQYLVALPKLGGLAQPFSGNLGLSGISPVVALVAIPIGLIWAGLAAWRLGRQAGLATAVSLALIVQPTVGFNYASILIPAVILLWLADRLTGLLLALAVIMLSPLSPPSAAVLVAVAATVVGLRQRTADGHPAAAGAATT